jgi:uncharacterized protein YutE (UPF0331/DUF86 family)
MEKIELALLKAEIDAQVVEIDHIFTRLAERKKKKGKVVVESIGYQLHNLYCAFEDLFKIIAEAFENHIQDKSRYHVELLRRMTIPIQGVRPLLLGKESSSLLENLRSFRHFFRHAYSYELDERKVKIVFEDAFKLKEIYQCDINSFLKNI